jgi:hypothetical protein
MRRCVSASVATFTLQSTVIQLEQRGIIFWFNYISNKNFSPAAVFCLMNVRGGGAWCANEIDSQIRAARNAMHLIKIRVALAQFRKR